MHPRTRHLLAAAAATTAWLAACAVPDYSDPRADGAAGDSAGGDAATPDTGGPGPLLTCESCHTSEAMLKEALVGKEEPPAEHPSTGDG